MTLWYRLRAPIRHRRPFTILMLISLFAAVPLIRQEGQAATHTNAPRERVLLDETWGTPSFVAGTLSAGPALAPREEALEFFSRRQAQYKLVQPTRELRLVADFIDTLGQRHLRFDQAYRGLRVWGRQTIVHFDRDSRIYLVGGQTIPTPSIPTMADVPADSAREIALRAIAGQSPEAEMEGRPELLVYPQDGTPYLAWLVTATVPGSNAFRWRVFVNAQTSAVLLAFNEVPSDGPATGSGIDVAGEVQALETYERGDTFQLINATRPMYAPPVDSLTGVIVTYDYWRGGGSITSDPSGDNVFDDNIELRAAVSGHVYAGQSYGYFLSAFGRNSFDDSGGSIIVSVHDALYTNNAYWGSDGSVNFADGDGINYLPFSGSLDVVAHELAHGVTQYTAGLIYAFQPGALNEHYSDFFGAMLDRDDWLIGEDIRLTAPGCVRSMSDPGLTGQPAHMSEYADLPGSHDNGGVHINSGIPNRLSYLVATALDRERAEQIWYRTLTVYLTPGATFPFWALVTLQATEDLHGAPSVELDAVTAAIDSIGLGGVYATPQQVSTLDVTLGQSVDTAVTFFNLGSLPVEVDSVTTSRSELIVTGPSPISVALLDTVRYQIVFDATGLVSDCDIGLLEESVIFHTSSALVPTVELPVTVRVTYVPADPDTTLFATACTELVVARTPGMRDFYRDSIDALFDASLLIGLVSDTDTIVYSDVGDLRNLAVVDTFVADTQAGQQTRTLRYVSPDQRLHGSVTYSYAPSDPSACDYFLISYDLHNSCDTPLTFYSGIYADFNLPAFTINHGEFSSGRELIMIRDDLDTRACGLALTSGHAYNLRSIHNPTVVWDGFTPAEAYTELAASTHAAGALPDDWSALLTFGETTLGTGDSVHFDVALIYSNTGTAGVIAVAEALGTGDCVVSLSGDVNLSGVVNAADIIGIVYYVFRGGPAPVPIAAAGDVNCDGAVSSADAVRLILYVFKGGAPPCDVCSIL